MLCYFVVKLLKITETELIETQENELCWFSIKNGCSCGLIRSVETVHFPFKINVSTLHRESAMPSCVTSGNTFLSEYSKTLMFAFYFTCTN